MSDLESKVEVLAERISNLLDRLDRDDESRKALEVQNRAAIDELSKRVSSLERSRAALVAAGAFAGAVLGWLGNIILSFLTK